MTEKVIWTPLSERHPDNWDHVYVANDEFELAKPKYFDGIFGVFCDAQNHSVLVDITVTKWRPIPPLPEKE